VTEEAKPEGEAEKKDGEPAPEDKPEEAANEGGDEDEKKEEAAKEEGEDNKEVMAPPPNPYEGIKPADYEGGYEGLPTALLNIMVAYPMVGDMIKQEALQWEFNPEGAKAGNFTGLAGLMGNAFSESGENKDMWLGGHVSALDFAALKDISEAPLNLKAIHFPFFSIGWESKEKAIEAINHDLQTMQNKGDYHAVVFELKEAKAIACATRMVAHKHNGTIDKAGELKDNITFFEVTAAPMDAEVKTVADWKKAKEAVAAAAAAAGDKKEEGADDKKEEPAKEGEEGEKPAEDKPAAE